ncbi:MAG: pilus assembly protein, partial [Burkholderiaceae bacterium]
MMARSCHSARQRGMTLISVLVSLLIFAFGLLALAGLYGRLMSAQTGN